MSSSGPSIYRPISPIEPVIELSRVTLYNIQKLKSLNNRIFPAACNEAFYKYVLEEAGELAKLAYCDDMVVGAVCCKIDTSEKLRRLYIMTIGCLSPYRRQGIGSLMLEHVLKYVEQDGNFDSIFLHLQVNNFGAIRFFREYGFKIVEKMRHFYKTMDPEAAYVLHKTIRHRRRVTPAQPGMAKLIIATIPTAAAGPSSKK